MSEWHDPSCRRLDVFTSSGISSCLSCGSVQSGPDPSSPDDENIHSDIYQTLENSTDMRVLTLDPGGHDDLVCGSLHLTTTSGFLEYDAISYTWAGENENVDRSGHITLNSRCFAVTQNCEAALRRARSRSGPKAIWIDAICINQEDLRERGHQVRLMQQIYSRAESVLIYLGEPSREEDELLAFISGQELPSKDRDLHRRLRKALCRLFQRRYFSRVWVLQEVALARRAILICGRHSIPWSLMGTERLERIGLLEYPMEYPKGLGHYTPMLSGLDRLPPILDFRAPAFRDPSELLGILEKTRGSQASDPRDKVFALLGLLICPESDGLVADYTKTTADVYTSIAIWIAQRFGLPALLIRTCIIRQRQHVEHQEPQWVPNWAYNDLQRLTPGLRESPWESEESAKPLGARLPVTVCERDTVAIRFPAFILGTADRVLRRRKQNACSVFVSVPNSNKDCFLVKDTDYLALFSHPSLDRESSPELESEMERTFSLDGRFIHLNYRVKRQEMAVGKAYQPNPPGTFVAVEGTMATDGWTRDLIYLIPEPRDDGFQFTEPGFVTVSKPDARFHLKKWTHRNAEGKETTGCFSRFAICCSEHHEGDRTRIYLRGLLEHAMARAPEPGRFEFVSAR